MACRLWAAAGRRRARAGVWCNCAALLPCRRWRSEPSLTGSTAETPVIDILSAVFSQPPTYEHPQVNMHGHTLCTCAHIHYLHDTVVLEHTLRFFFFRTRGPHTYQMALRSPNAALTRHTPFLSVFLSFFPTSCSHRSSVDQHAFTNISQQHISLWRIKTIFTVHKVLFVPVLPVSYAVMTGAQETEGSVKKDKKRVLEGTVAKCLEKLGSPWVWQQLELKNRRCAIVREIMYVLCCIFNTVAQMFKQLLKGSIHAKVAHRFFKG